MIQGTPKKPSTLNPKTWRFKRYLVLAAGVPAAERNQDRDQSPTLLTWRVSGT